MLSQKQKEQQVCATTQAQHITDENVPQWSEKNNWELRLREMEGE